MFFLNLDFFLNLNFIFKNLTLYFFLTCQKIPNQKIFGIKYPIKFFDQSKNFKWTNQRTFLTHSPFFSKFKKKLKDKQDRKEKK